MNLVWRAPDPVPVQNEADEVVSQAPFVEASREVVPERVGGVEVQSHVMEALEDDLDKERERKCQWLTPAVRPEFLSGTDFLFLSRTVRDTECLMSTVVDGSSGNVEVFPMKDDAAGHVPREPRVQLDRRRLQVQDTPQSIQDRQSDESEGEVAAVPLLVDHGVSGGVLDRPLHDTESLSSQGFSTDIDGQSEVSGVEEAEEICGGHRSQEGVRQEKASFSQECCCTGQHEGASFHDRNWRAGLSRS